MAFQDIVNVMPPATWYELSGTRMSAVYAISNTSDPRYGVKGPQSVPEDWGGGAFDTKNEIFLLHGGGHLSYGGNEVYQFDLATMTWTVNTPSTYVDDGGGAYHTTDNAPVSAHTYDGLQCIPGTNLMFKVGGSNWETGNNYDTNAYLFDTQTKTWQKKAAPPTSILEPATAYDASRHSIWVLERNSLLRYDITGDSWTTEKGGLPSHTDYSMAYDSTRDRLLILKGAAPKGQWVDCTNPSAGLNNITFTGDSFSTFRAGLEYDAARDQFVVWTGGRKVTAIDPYTYVAETINASSGVAPVEASSLNDYHGTYGKWRYDATHDVFIAYQAATGNVWLYKGGTAGSGPAPGWGNPTRRVKISVNPGEVTGSHGGFRAVLTRANLPDEACDPSGSHSAQVNGGDVRISLDGGGFNRLPMQVVSFGHDTTTGAGDAEVEIWTKLPTLDASSSFYLWYSAPATQVQPGTADSFGRDEVFTGLIAGWHCDNVSSLSDVTGAGNDIPVSLSNGLGGGPYAGSVLQVKYNTIAKSPSLPLNQDYTITGLISPNTFGNGEYVVELWGAGDTNRACAVRTDSGTTVAMRVYDSQGPENMAINQAVSFSGWSLLSISTSEGVGVQKAYKNGSQVGSTKTIERIAGKGHLALHGAGTQIKWAKAFIAKGLLDADYLSTQSNNMTDPGGFFSTGSPETPPSQALIVSHSRVLGTLSTASSTAALTATLTSTSEITGLLFGGVSSVSVVATVASTSAVPSSVSLSYSLAALVSSTSAVPSSVSLSYSLAALVSSTSTVFAPTVRTGAATPVALPQALIESTSDLTMTISRLSGWVEVIRAPSYYTPTKGRT